MITFMESIKDPPTPPTPPTTHSPSIDPQLWHACAGSMVSVPPLHSKVYYFPQGHFEHSLSQSHAATCPPPHISVPPLVLCHLSAVHYLADPDSDEVFAKLLLTPLNPSQNPNFSENDHNIPLPPTPTDSEKPASFAKTLTQSDANNGGGFSVPRYCAETIFPRLDYTADPPVQTVLAKDVHGTVWKFRHIYRGTPRRHLLTTGWSTFVNHKKLVAGDSIVFLRAENGELCVGIRRAKRGGFGGGFGSGGGEVGWGGYGGGGFNMFLREDEGSKHMLKPNTTTSPLKSKLLSSSVLSAARLASEGRPFEVTFFPRGSTPEFCVRAGAVRASLRTRWAPGLRFKMAFETEDSSRVSWFMGTVCGVEVMDAVRWPNSPWRLLQVNWDEPDLLQNVKRVSPWLVELVSNIPSIHLAPFSPPRKKLCLPSISPSDFPFAPSFPPFFAGTPVNHHHHHHHHQQQQPPVLSIQGARHHARFAFSPPDPQLSYQRPCIENRAKRENISCFLTISTSERLEKEQGAKKPHLMLFGKRILTEKQICSAEEQQGQEDQIAGGKERESVGLGLGLGLGFEAGHCKVFMESEDVGRTLDLSGFGSYEELYGRLSDMFGVEKEELMRHVSYRDSSGAVKQTGDEPFSEFMKSARRLTILADAGNENVER